MRHKTGWVKHYDLEEPEELCDKAEFQALAKQVEKIVAKHGPMTYNEIEKELGECPDGWLIMILDVWNTDVLEKVQVGSFRKYRKKDRPPMKVEPVENAALFAKGKDKLVEPVWRDTREK